MYSLGIWDLVRSQTCGHILVWRHNLTKAEHVLKGLSSPPWWTLRGTTRALFGNEPWLTPGNPVLPSLCHPALPKLLPGPRGDLASVQAEEGTISSLRGALLSPLASVILCYRKATGNSCFTLLVRLPVYLMTWRQLHLREGEGNPSHWRVCVNTYPFLHIHLHVVSASLCNNS